MTEYEYIMKQCRKFHFTKWDEKELRACQEVLPNLTREELVKLYRSKWVNETLKNTVFKVLFADKIGKREQRIKDLDTDALIEEVRDKKSGNVALIRKEMRNRYKENKGYDRSKIAVAFNASTKGDQQWVRSQERKERYKQNESNNYNYRNQL